jgi:hypothetical protein
MELKLFIILCLIISIESIDQNESVNFELSKSKHIIYSHGNKVIYENRTTKIQHILKKKLSSPTTTLLPTTTTTASTYRTNNINNDKFDFMTELVLTKINQLLETETLIKNVTTNKTNHNAIIEFNYSINFVNLLNQIDLNKILIQIRQFSKQGYIFQLNTNLSQPIFNTNNSSSNFLNILNKDELNSISCFKRTNLNTNLYLLDSVSFKIKRYGYFIVCIQFIDSNGKFVYLSTEQYCYDWTNESKDKHNEEIGFHYKPLFIVIMYFMCASILIPIAVWQHFINKFKMQKKKKEKNKLNLINEKEKNNKLCVANDSDKSLSSKNVIGSETMFSINNKIINSQELEPLIEVEMNNNNNNNTHLKLKKSVLFDLESTQSEKDDDNDEQSKVDLSNSVNHILDQKPWLSTDQSTFYNYNASLDNLNNVESRRATSDLNLNSRYYRGTKHLREKSIKISTTGGGGGGTGSIKKKSLSNSKLNLFSNKEIITKCVSNRSISSKTAIYYESNV